MHRPTYKSRCGVRNSATCLIVFTLIAAGQPGHHVGNPISSVVGPLEVCVAGFQASVLREWLTNGADATNQYLNGLFDVSQVAASAFRHLWPYIASELLIGIAQGLLCIMLAFGTWRHPHSPLARSASTLALFIGACGLIQCMNVFMLRWPVYRLDLLIRVFTAAVGVCGAAVAIPLIPRILTLRRSSELEAEIIQRRRTELELRHLHAQLEGVIEQRTAQLASKNEEMEQFLNTVSHDLKSPVVTCLGLIPMIREHLERGERDAVDDSIRRMERSVNRMRQLIDDLLNLSRIGKVRFDATEFDADALIRSICDDLRPRFSQIGADLRIETPLPRIRGDVHWLTEVFENLIINAMKYGCDNPQPRITVGSTKHGSEHHFYVRDNGIGIDPSQHSVVFEPFRRLPTNKEGSGMGLAIVDKIVRMHRGKVWVESSKGQGATFWIALPAVASLELTSSLTERPASEISSPLTGASN